MFIVLADICLSLTCYPRYPVLRLLYMAVQVESTYTNTTITGNQTWRVINRLTNHNSTHRIYLLSQNKHHEIAKSTPLGHTHEETETVNRRTSGSKLDSISYLV